MAASDHNHLPKITSSDRDRFLRENYGVPEMASYSNDACYFLSRLSEHFGILSALALRMGTFNSAELQSNDQFVCADICVEKLSNAKWQGLDPAESTIVHTVWEKLAQVHKSIATRTKSRDESESLYLMFFTTCFLTAIANCDNC